MKRVFFLLLTILTPIASQANDVPFLACDRKAIRQAIEVSRLETRRTRYEIHSRKDVRQTDLLPDLTILETLEKKIFGKKLFNLSHDYLPGASISVNEGLNIVSIFPGTIKDLNRLSENPLGAHAFIISHEVGHMVQAHWKKHNKDSLSTMGLTYGHRSDSDEFNLLHAETDCIGIELMQMAGFDTSLAVPAVKLTTEICKPTKNPGVCERAEQIRVKSIQTYLESF